MKRSSPQAHRLSPGYRDRLAERFSPEIADALDRRGWRTTHSSVNPDRLISYVQVGSPEKGDIQLVGGFTEGVINQAPLIAALAKNGYRVTMADHGAKGLLRNPNTGKRSALFTRAADSMDVARLHRPKAVVTHSMASLALSQMAGIAVATKESTLQDVDGIMLAPAGMDGRWSRAFAVARRFVSKLTSESPKKVETFSFPDTEGDMFKAGTHNLTSTPGRSAREVGELVTDLVDVDQIHESGMSRLAVLGFAEDPLYADKIIGDRTMDFGLRYAVPVSYRKDLPGGPWGGRNATHDDGQFYPERVADAIEGVLELPTEMLDVSRFATVESVLRPQAATAVIEQTDLPL